MNINGFYTFNSKLSSLTIQAHTIGLNRKGISSSISDEHRLIQGDYNGIDFPVTFKQEYGEKSEDILDTGWPSLYLISGKLKSIFEDNNLTGWKLFTIRLLDKNSNEINGYHGLSITGRCGQIDYGKSEIIEKKLIPNGPLSRYYKGLNVGLDEWDSSDFFLPEKYFGIITTKNVCNIMKKNKVTNVRFQNLAEIEIPIIL